MTDLEIQIVMDSIGQALLGRGHDPDAIEEYIKLEGQRVAQEIRDEADADE